MPTHPSFGHYEDTVANALAYRYRDEGIPFVFRPVNRLDRDTSGLLLIARNRRVAGYLSRAMKEHGIQKIYLCILKDSPQKQEDTLRTYMRRTAQSVIVRENCGPNEGGDEAITHYRVLASADGYALVCAAPLTGRTHQLRVHFAHLGHPITGDDLYGTPSHLISRHALHARTLSFPHPTTEKRLQLCAPLPDDMKQALEQALPNGTWIKALQNPLKGDLYES